MADDVPDQRNQHPSDVMFVGQATESGNGQRVLRMRDDRLEIGEIRELQEGRAIHGEVLNLHQRSEHAQLFDVEVTYDGRDTRSSRRPTSAGPAQVATDAYRRQWDAIFATKPEWDKPN